MHGAKVGDNGVRNGQRFTLGYWLKVKRLDAGMSQKRLSEKILEMTGRRIPQTTISSWEKEKSIPSLSIVFLIVNALGISVLDIPWSQLDFKEEIDKNERR